MSSRSPRPAQAKPAEPAIEEQSQVNVVVFTALGATLVLLALAFLLGGSATKIAVGAVALGCLGGFLYGAVRAFAFLLGLALAALAAPLLGGWLEGATSVALGTTGLTNRAVSLLLAAIVVIVAATIGGEIGARRLLASRPNIRRWNRAIGMGLGFIEGWILFTIVAWGALALEPVAGANLASGDEEQGGASGGVSRLIVSFASSVRESGVGHIATSLNPMGETRIFRLVDDFAVVASSPDSLARFRESPAIRDLESRPAVQRALESIQNDPELVALLEEEEMTPATMRAILDNPTLLRAIDEHNLIRELGPFMDAVEEALAEARSQTPAKEVPDAPPVLRGRGRG